MFEPNKTYDIFNGTSRRERRKGELATDFVQIDERTIPDMLQFVQQYAELVNFITKEHLDYEDTDYGNWGEFFNRDNLIVLITISNFEINEIEEFVHLTLDKAFSATEQDLKVLHLNEMVSVILSMAEALDYIRKHLDRDAFTSDLIFDIGNAIKSELKHELQNLYGYSLSLSWEQAVSNRFTRFEKDWGCDFSQVETAFREMSTADVEQVKEIYHSFFFTVHHIIQKSKQMLEVMMKEMKNNKPHIALYMTFLELFEYVKDIQNQLPKKHLDHYYREVLKQGERSFQSDKVYCNLTLNDGVENFYLEKGTPFDAGKNTKGEELIYEQLKSTSLTSTKVAKICTLYKTVDNRYHQQPGTNYVTDVYSAELDRPKKGHFEFPGRPLFGEEQFRKINEEKTLNESRLGLIVASSVLNLSTGKRKIEITFEFEKEGFDRSCSILNEVAEKNEEPIPLTINKAFTTAFLLSISTEKGLKSIPAYGFRMDQSTCRWIIDFELGVNEEPFKGVLKPLDGNYPELSLPFVEVLLKHECSLYMYSVVEELKLKNIQINTKSEQLKDFVLSNNYGGLNANSPFEWFGPIPKNNSFFIFGHKEAFTKQINELKLNFSYYSLPIVEGGMEEYYKQYFNPKLEASVDEVKTKQYQLSASLLQDGIWNQYTEYSQSLFSNAEEQEAVLADQYQNGLEISLNMKAMGQEPAIMSDPFIHDQNSLNGFLKFELNCPDFAFGHETYTKVLSETVLKNSTKKKKEKTIEQPNQPFAPVIDGVEMSYSAVATAQSERTSNPGKEEVEYYHLTPFGYEKKTFKSSNQSIPFTYTESGESSLYLGLDKYPLRGELSLLFVMDGDVSGQEDMEVPEVQWYYLENNLWYPFGANGVMNDSTNGFMNTGIMGLKIPAKIDSGNTILPSDYLWVKGVVKHGTLGLGRVKALYENGVELEWNGEATAVHLGEPLPAETIVQVKEKLPKIAEVHQPVKSFLGREAEDEIQFYQRLSERLRHKNRAITSLDYEEIILEQFPLIHKVKCFTANHTLTDDYREIPHSIVPGSVRITVIPDIHQAQSKLCPRVSSEMLLEISNHLRKLVSPFVQMELSNAYYEQIRVICKVTFTRIRIR